MKKDDVNKKHTSTWTKINDDSKSKKWRRIFMNQWGGEFIKISRNLWEWKEVLPEPEPEPEIKVIKPAVKSWVVTRPNGKEDQINNLSKYCREHKLDDGAIYRVLNGQRNHHKGYKIRKGD